MKLEIDIPSIIYQDAKENRNYISLTKSEIVWKAIADGKLLEQEPILDKIRAELEQIEINGHIRDVECFRAGINTALNVIDKYKAESEDKDDKT